MTGHGLPQDIDRAWYWFNEAAKQSFEEARLNLGKMYREGLVKDFTESYSNIPLNLYVSSGAQLRIIALWRES